MNYSPLLPTQEQFAKWDSEYFDGERENFDIMMIKAFQSGADRQLEQVIDWFRKYPTPDLETYAVITQIAIDLEKAMRQQEDTP